MADRSAIEWCDATINPILARRRDTGKIGFHCEHVSDGCKHCYSETFNRRGLPNRGTGLAYKPGHRADVEIFLDERALLKPLHWRKPRRIFVGSMTDLFADFVDDAMLDRVFAVMALCPQHTFQLLTKRPERMRAWLGRNRTGGWIFHVASEIDPKGFGAKSGRWPLPNVWLGVSVEDQATADARIRHLLATPAAVRFVSAEPLLGPIDLGLPDLEVHHHPDNVPSPMLDSLVASAADMMRREAGVAAINWVIVGGESGPHARPMRLTWARSLRDQCARAGVPFFMKQLSDAKSRSRVVKDIRAFPEDLQIREMPHG